MRKWLFLLLAALLLTGCSEQAPPPTEPSTVPTGTQAPTWPESSGLYTPGSELEIMTERAVKLCPLEEGTYGGLMRLGDDLVLIREGSRTQLMLLTGGDLKVSVTQGIYATLTKETGWLQVGKNGAAYFDEADKALVFLNATLQETSRLRLPENLMGGAYLTPDMAGVYYCTDTGVQVMDLNTGTSRCLREHTGSYHAVTGVLMDGKVLRYRSRLEDGSYMTQILSCQTGQTLWTGEYLNDLEFAGEHYLLQMKSRAIRELVFGNDKESPRNLWTDTQDDAAVMLTEAGIVTVQENQQESTLTLYDLDSGKKTAAVVLPGIGKIRDVCAGNDGSVWILGENVTLGEPVICGWNPQMTQVADETVYAQPHYTVAQQDAQGLEACKAAASALAKQYGVDILIAGDAASLVLGGYGFDCEYLCQAYDRYLPELQQALSMIPQELYEAAAGKTKSRTIHIGLVRGITGAEKYGTLPQVGGVQFWKDKEMYVLLAVDDDLVQNFCNQMYHALETRLLSASDALYDWDKLNPEGFQYDNDYIANANRDGSPYLQEGQQAFIDTFSMSFLKEDRARIFEYACLPGNEQLFQSEILQAKLKMLCAGIREAYRLRGDTYIWEQYLIK